MTNNDELAHNPVLAYADSYRSMANQGSESVPVWGVITDLERYIAPLYAALLAERNADKKRIAELEREKETMTAAELAMRDDMRDARSLLEARTVSVKLPGRCECCYSEQEAALFDGIVEEYTEALKSACADAGINLEVGE